MSQIEFFGEAVHNIDGEFDFFDVIPCIGDIKMNNIVNNVDMKVLFIDDWAILRDKNTVATLDFEVPFELFHLFSGDRGCIVLVLKKNIGESFIFSC